MKKLLVLGALVASLLAPTGVFAANVTGTSTESLTIASSLTAVFPASLTYSGAGPVFTAAVAITSLSSNDAAGNVLSVKAHDLTGPVTIVNARRTSSLPVSSGLTPGAAVALGGYVGSPISGSVTLGTSGGQVSAGGSLNYNSNIDTTGMGYPGGTFTGALDFTFAGN